MRIFFIGGSCGRSVGGESDALGHRLERAELAPPRYQQEEAEVDQRADLRDVVAAGRRRLRTEIAEREEEDDEDAEHVFVPVGAVSNRLDRTAIEPGQE